MTHLSVDLDDSWAFEYGIRVAKSIDVDATAIIKIIARLIDVILLLSILRVGRSYHI